MNYLPFVLYWILFLGVFTTVFALYDGQWLGSFLFNLIRLPFMWGIAYFAFHRNFNMPEIPIFFKIGLILILIVGAVLLSRFVVGITVFPVYFKDEYTFQFWNFNKLFNQAVLITAGVAGYGTLTYLLEKSVWRAKRDELIMEKQAVELNFYRAQVHPHFLFNTLNGIYAESLKAEGKTSELILKLSGLLRYMLYECNRKSIALKTEIQVLENYLALEVLRYGDRLDVRLKVDPELSENTQIPPLIFLAITENAFKHGVSAQLDESFVSIAIQKQKEKLRFIVENTDFAEQTDETGYQQGIGLKNIHRQLELIYGDRFFFKQEKENGIFKTELRIPLS